MTTKTETPGAMPRWAKWIDAIVLRPFFLLLPFAAVLAILLRLGADCERPVPLDFLVFWLPLGWLAFLLAVGFLPEKHPGKYHGVFYPAILLGINAVSVCLALIAAGLFIRC
jgi:hypothetical protein